MEFPDFAFDPSLPSFIHHSEVLKYLEDYTDRFSIRPHIKFNTKVVSVIPVLGEGKNSEISWDATFQTLDNGDPVTERFDAIMVCVGYPEVFSFHSVVVQGAGPSGFDISLELSPHAKHVYLSHRSSPLQWIPPANLSFVPPVVRATANSLICEDGSEIMADTLIFCTGYKYTYPFLLTSSYTMDNQKIDRRDKMKRKNVDKLMELKSGKGFKKNEENSQVNETLTVKSVLPRVDLLEDEDIVGTNAEQGHYPPLYKHLFHARYPTLGFIGAVKFVLPFPLFHFQVQFFLFVLEGKFQLPPPDKMLSESREEVLKTQNSGIPL
ncbi:hypothetical protein AB205_0115190, partial [Aquarana catesbeiana]